MVDDSSRVVASGLLPSLPTANVFLEGGKLHDVTHFEQIAYLLRCLSRHVSCVSVSLGLWVRFRVQLAHDSHHMHAKTNAKTDGI